VAPAFPIDLRFRSGLTTTQREAFVEAAARWQRVIVAPLPKVKVGAVVTTGVVIDAQGVSIDGPSGILGQAGPTFLRPATMGRAAFLPCIGTMAFDVADLAEMEADRTIVDVITHEMGHVLGIGTVWRRKGRLVGAGTPRPAFIGPGASAAYGRLVNGGAPRSVPVEDQGGPGTRDSHWRERTFGPELMTGYVSRPGVLNPLSRVTVASLADLGYVVDVTAAEAYALPEHLESAIAGAVPQFRRHCLPTIPFSAE